MVEADYARQLPAALVLLPDVGELRDLDQLLGLARQQLEEAMYAHFHGTVVVERIDLEGAGYELATCPVILARFLSRTGARNPVQELLARLRHEAILVVEHLEVVGDHFRERGQVAAIEECGEERLVGGSNFVGQLLSRRGTGGLRQPGFREGKHDQSRREPIPDLHGVTYFHFSRATIRPISACAALSSGTVSFDSLM